MKKARGRKSHATVPFRLPAKREQRYDRKYKLKGTHARDFMVRFSQFFGIIQ
jgi:hypothetical protein